MHLETESRRQQLLPVCVNSFALSADGAVGLNSATVCPHRRKGPPALTEPWLSEPACACFLRVCIDSHRQGYRQQRLKIERYFTVIVKLEEYRELLFGGFEKVCVHRRFLPGFSKLFEQTGSVLVPPSSEPPLHLPFRATRLLAQTFYGSLRTNRSELRVLVSRKHTWGGHGGSYLRGVFGNFTVVGLQRGDVRGFESCDFFDTEQRGQRCSHKPAGEQSQTEETKIPLR